MHRELRTKEVAHILDCSPDDVILACQQGILKAHQVGRFWRIRYAAAMKFKREYRQERTAWVKRGTV